MDPTQDRSISLSPAHMIETDRQYRKNTYLHRYLERMKYDIRMGGRKEEVDKIYLLCLYLLSGKRKNHQTYRVNKRKKKEACLYARLFLEGLSAQKGLYSPFHLLLTIRFLGCNSICFSCMKIDNLETSWISASCPDRNDSMLPPTDTKIIDLLRGSETIHGHHIHHPHTKTNKQRHEKPRQQKQ